MEGDLGILSLGTEIKKTAQVVLISSVCPEGKSDKSTSL